MRRSYERGNFVEWLLMFFAITVVIFVFVVPWNRLNFGINVPSIGETTNGGTVGPTPGGSVSPLKTTSSRPTTSVGKAEISISTGNASYSLQPAEEYIILENRGTAPVDITGWRLENGVGSRVYAAGSNEVRYSSDTAIIPQGAKIIAPSGQSYLSDIVLKPGEKAFVVSGSPGNLSTYTLVSFKENECTSYFGNDYRFSAGQERSCISPASEPGVRNLDIPCQNLIDTFQGCHVPTFNSVDSSGRTVTSSGTTCNGCIEGKTVTNICSNFISSHYNYAGCVANHAGDANFEGKTWHIYLYRPWEMWAQKHETISLYDTAGNLRATASY
jgi:hypothetical protein